MLYLDTVFQEFPGVQLRNNNWTNNGQVYWCIYGSFWPRCVKKFNSHYINLCYVICNHSCISQLQRFKIEHGWVITCIALFDMISYPCSKLLQLILVSTPGMSDGPRHLTAPFYFPGMSKIQNSTIMAIAMWRHCSGVWHNALFLTTANNATPGLTLLTIFTQARLFCVKAVIRKKQYCGRLYHELDPDSKVHGANMGPTWVLLAPDGPHIGPMNLAISGGAQNRERISDSCSELIAGSGNPC